MKIYSTLLVGVCLGIGISSPLVYAADQDRDRTQLQSQDRDQIYGYQLMTQQERMEYRNRMREAKTAQEREQIRNQHHKLMQERARERGISLPDNPPARGMGGGMGPGGGMMPGGGRNR